MEFQFFKFYDIEGSFIINQNYPNINIKDASIDELDIPDNLKRKLKIIGLDLMSSLILTSKTYYNYYNFSEEDVKIIYHIIYQYLSENDENFEEVEPFLDKDALRTKKNNKTNNSSEETKTKKYQININDDDDEDYDDENNTIYYELNPDVDIAVLDLSIRSYGALVKSGIDTINKLIKIPEYELYRIRNFGRKCVKEVISKLNAYYENKNNEKEEDSFDKNNIKRLLFTNSFILNDEYLYVKGTNYGFKDALLTVLNLNFRANRILEEQNFNFISDIININSYSIIGIEGFGKGTFEKLYDSLLQYITINLTEINQEELKYNYLKNEIISTIKDTSFDGIKRSILIEAFSKQEDEETVIDIINELINENIIFIYEDDKLFYRYQSFPQYLYTLPKSEIKDIMYSRIDGISLQEISEKYNCTRERIRQKQEKFIKTLTDKIFREDRFKYLYETYRFEKVEFCEIFKEKERTYNYLNMRYNRGQLDYKDAILDEKVAPRLKSLIQKYLNRNFITIGEETFLNTRNNLFRYYTSHFCNEPKLLEDITKEYNEFEQKYSSKEERKEMGEKYIANRLSESSIIVSCYNRKYKYYDFNAYDFTELLNFIDLDSYMDIQISTKIFFNKDPKFFENYQINNYYELHSVLKKIYLYLTEEYEIRNKEMIQFGHMPFIIVGNFDKGLYLAKVINRLISASKEEIFEEIERETGISKGVAINIFSDELYKYRSKQARSGTKYTCSKILTDEEIKLIQNTFTEEFYNREDASLMIKELGFDDIEVIAQAGYTVTVKYVIKNGLSVYQYVKQKIQENEIFNAKDFFLKDDTVTYHVLTELRENYEYLQFEEGMYISIKKLEKFGITKEDIINFNNEVLEKYQDQLFSYKNIQDDFEDHILLSLGFGQIFIENIILYSRLFKSHSYKNVFLFKNKKYEFNKRDIIISILTKQKRIDSEDLIKILYDKYNIELTTTYIATIIKDTTIYYDQIMDAYYLDYSVYYEEI